MKEIRLTTDEAASAAAIQAAIDGLGEAGGRVVLPAMELTLDRGIELRSNVELVGQGRDTILRKAPGRMYPLSGYHNYGMLDVPLLYTEGLAPGMTVALRDDRHGGFFETFARITWVDSGWVGIDQGLHSDYEAELHPVLVTAFPLIFGLEVDNVVVRGLTLDGQRATQPAGIGACRGAAVYFLRSHQITVQDVVEADFAGEGLGFQMCSHLNLRNCRFTGNAGNGFHPGAGSTAVVFENCVAEGNDAAGFFFCVRANHITVRDCVFSDNHGPGISIGTRDSHNLIETCTVERNDGPGVLFRPTQRPVAMHDCRLRGCTVRDNARESGGDLITGSAQIAVLGDAYDVALEDNEIAAGEDRETAGIHVAPTATRIWLSNNQITGCFPKVMAEPASLIEQDPVVEAGLDAVKPVHFRHLRPEARHSPGGVECR